MKTINFGITVPLSFHPRKLKTGSAAIDTSSKNFLLFIIQNILLTYLTSTSSTSWLLLKNRRKRLSKNGLDRF